jgi:hypothetical protein
MDLKRRRIMIPIKKTLILTVLVGAIILLLTPTSMFPRIVHNGAGGVYEEGDGTSGTNASTLSMPPTIEVYVITGAGYYLNAYSDILVFLNRVELSDLKGMDYNESRQILDRALDNMNRALKTYECIIEKAEVTPYKETLISKLMDFDYTGFMQERSLNSVIYAKVEEYLKKGDITGICRQLHAEFIIITRLLYSIRDELYFEKLPGMSIIWRLNERCSQTLLFGQYASRVFYAVHYNTL